MSHVAIMQPYFFPYLGYFQLIAHVDQFVLYDDIEFSKQTWITRNRILSGSEWRYINLAIKRDSDFLDICQRELSPEFDRQKLLRVIHHTYGKAPFFEEMRDVVTPIIENREQNLFRYLRDSIVYLSRCLGANTTFIDSSQIGIDRAMRGQERVISTCLQLNATRYTNPIGGMKMYDRNVFRQSHVELNFLEASLLPYNQGSVQFVPGLSIIDILAWTGISETKRMISSDYVIK